jgi:hypothetical protein
MSPPDGRRRRPPGRKAPPTELAAASVTPTAPTISLDLELVAAHLAGHIAGHIADMLDRDPHWRPDAVWLAGVLTQPRCKDCKYPLSAPSSIAAGRGWRCQAKRAARGAS